MFVAKGHDMSRLRLPKGKLQVLAEQGQTTSPEGRNEEDEQKPGNVATVTLRTSCEI